MSYKKILIISLVSLSVIACSRISNSINPFQASQAIDRFKIQDGLAVDVRSNLMWTRCLLGTTWNGLNCEGRIVLYNWKQAQSVAKTVNYGGYNDWRIPTLDEIKTLADQDNTTSPVTTIPYLNQAVFPMPNCDGVEGGLDSNGHACWHWTSTLIDGSDYYLWIVYFGYGYGNANDTADTVALRLVRNN